MAKMIKSATMLILVATLSLVAAVISANGQTPNIQVADIPFAFTAGDQELGAGRYRLTQMNENGLSVRITNTETERTVIRLSNTLVHTNPAKVGKLVFHRYGDTYFLAEVWRAGDTVGSGMRKSAQEKALQREVAANQMRYERVEIAMLK